MRAVAPRECVGKNPVLLLDGPRHLRRERRLLLPLLDGERMWLYGDIMRDTISERAIAAGRSSIRRSAIQPHMGYHPDAILRTVLGSMTRRAWIVCVG